MGHASAPADIFYVWHLPVRITHWVSAIAFFTLAITGVYIGAPLIFIHGPPMLQVRIVHVLAGYVLTCSVAVRVVWAFIGDRGASWRSFFPYLKQGGWGKIYQELRFYLFLRRTPPSSSAVVNVSHFLVLLAFLFEIVTGFALLSLSGSHSVAGSLFGWIFLLFPSQYVRLGHVIVMWLLVAFTVQHIYVAALLDIKERSGLLSSIVTGYMGHERHS
jgi:Ni/Fe-hydrogenase 1 B-type cytochrome subunit